MKHWFHDRPCCGISGRRRRCIRRHRTTSSSSNGGRSSSRGTSRGHRGYAIDQLMMVVVMDVVHRLDPLIRPCRLYGQDLRCANAAIS